MSSAVFSNIPMSLNLIYSNITQLGMMCKETSFYKDLLKLFVKIHKHESLINLIIICLLCVFICFQIFKVNHDYEREITQLKLEIKCLTEENKSISLKNLIQQHNRFIVNRNFLHRRNRLIFYDRSRFW